MEYVEVECPSGLKVRVRQMTVADLAVLNSRSRNMALMLIQRMAEMVSSCALYEHDPVEHPGIMRVGDAEAIMDAICAMAPSKGNDNCPTCGANLGGRLIR